MLYQTVVVVSDFCFDGIISLQIFIFSENNSLEPH